MLFVPGDVRALADCITQAVSAPGVLSTLKDGARKRQHECSWQTTVAALTRIIEKTASDTA